MLLKGRTALITGAAQGIGLACAKAMIADGAHVILADIQKDAVIKAACGISSKAWGTFVDMGDKDSILELVDFPTDAKKLLKVSAMILSSLL